MIRNGVVARVIVADDLAQARRNAHAPSLDQALAVTRDSVLAMSK
jgi:hypothetical protein